MTSQINYAAITTSYPVAGQDNDSQGFRDNFTAISAGLATAKSEISGLQTNAVLKADLTAGTTIVNDMLGSTISNGLYSEFDGVYYDGGTISSDGATIVDITKGPLQSFTLAANPALTFTHWPTAGRYSSIRLLLIPDQAGVRYPIFQTENSGTIWYDNNYPKNFITGNPGFVQGMESVIGIVIADRAATFTSNPTFTFSAPSGVGGISAAAIENRPVTGQIFDYQPVSATVVNGGTGYAVGDKLTLINYPDVDMTVATISGGGATGPIATINVTLDTGAIWHSPQPDQPFYILPTTGAGTGGTVNLKFGISAVKITNPGYGYSLTDNVVITISGGGAVYSSNFNATNAAVPVLTQNNTAKVDVVEAWTRDKGTNVYIRYLGRYEQAA